MISYIYKLLANKNFYIKYYWAKLKFIINKQISFILLAKQDFYVNSIDSNDFIR